MTFDSIHKKYEQLVYTTAYGIVKTKERTEDVSQTTFMKVFEALEKGKEPKNVKNWIFTIAKHSALDLMRKEMDYVQIVEDITEDHEPTVIEDIIDDDTTYDNAYSIIYKYGAKHLETFVLYYHNGFNSKEIADELNISEIAVRARLRRTLRLYPPPTLDGRAPSLIATRSDLVCSATENIALIGRTFSLSSLISNSTPLATLFHSLLMSSLSSTLRYEL